MAYHDSEPQPEVISEQLPDLSDKLLKYGIYEEYKAYKKNYLSWRTGGARGARGELVKLDQQGSPVLNAQGSDDANQFERWYPNPHKFQFFFTVAYWRALTSLAGSLIFTFTSLLGCGGHSKFKPLAQWGEFIGAVIFTASTYLTYIELINVTPDKNSKKSKKPTYFFPHWPDVLQRVTWDSLVGTLVYLGGSLLFNVAVIAELSLSPGTSESRIFICCHLPACLGGLGFFIGGLCELSHTWIHASKVHGLGACAAIVNTVGGFTFFLAAAASVFSHERHSHKVAEFIGLNYLIGSALYAFSSVLLLIMWRSNDFGLTLLSQLNRAVRDGSVARVVPSTFGFRVLLRRSCPGLPVFSVLPQVDDEEDRNSRSRLSLRGVVFLTLMCWLWVAMLMNLLVGILWPERNMHHVLLWGMNLVGVLSVSILLVVHSTVVHVPNEQPFWFAMQSMRSIVVLAAVIQTGALVALCGENAHLGAPFSGVGPSVEL